jgi:hypothetical protein
MKDEFFNQLNYDDSQSITDAINDRVSNAVEDFVTANTQDHEDITAALQQAQEKIGTVPEDDAELREAYEMEAKRKVNRIRNAPKGLFHGMVSAMCEGVMKNQDTSAEFLEDGHINMDKVVDRTQLMYTFMEMLNTTRLAKVDEEMVSNVICGLRS